MGLDIDFAVAGVVTSSGATERRCWRGQRGSIMPLPVVSVCADGLGRGAPAFQLLDTGGSWAGRPGCERNDADALGETHLWGELQCPVLDFEH